MAAPFDTADPADLSPEQRLDALADILAGGAARVIKLASRSTPFNTSDSEQIGLDVSPDKSVHVTRPVNAQEKNAKGVQR